MLTEKLAKNVVDTLPVQVHEAEGSFLDIITIVKMIFEDLLPALEGCFENNNAQRGSDLHALAEECSSNTLRGRIKSIRFKKMIRRVTGREERRVLGGTNAIAETIITNAKQFGPDSLNEVWNECYHNRQ